MTSWLVRSTPDRAVRVRALAGNIALCSWARHMILTTPFSTQVYKWVPANLIGLITVSDAILTGRQSGQKLQCLYGNPMAKNFFQNRILHKL